MFKKILLTFSMFLFLYANAQETIKAGIKYTEITAREEAFRDIVRKIDKQYFKDFSKDSNKGENVSSIKSGNMNLSDRTLCPFYIGDTLALYGVSYHGSPYNTYYYNVFGKLVKFDIIKNDSYPIITYGYSKSGDLISVGFDASENEQFVYNDKGELKGHWVGNVVLNENNQSPKVLKIKRGFD